MPRRLATTLWPEDPESAGRELMGLAPICPSSTSPPSDKFNWIQLNSTACDSTPAPTPTANKLRRGHTTIGAGEFGVPMAITSNKCCKRLLIRIQKHLPLWGCLSARWMRVLEIVLIEWERRWWASILARASRLQHLLLVIAMDTPNSPAPTVAWPLRSLLAVGVGAGVELHAVEFS